MARRGSAPDPGRRSSVRQAAQHARVRVASPGAAPYDARGRQRRASRPVFTEAADGRVTSLRGAAPPGHGAGGSARHTHPAGSSRAERLRLCESRRCADRSQSRTSSSGSTFDNRENQHPEIGVTRASRDSDSRRRLLGELVDGHTNAPVSVLAPSLAACEGGGGLLTLKPARRSPVPWVRMAEVRRGLGRRGHRWIPVPHSRHRRPHRAVRRRSAARCLRIARVALSRDVACVASERRSCRRASATRLSLE